MAKNGDAVGAGSEDTGGRKLAETESTDLANRVDIKL